MGVSAPLDQPLQRFGRYELLLPIGKGGMAKVYLARTSELGVERRFAVKVMHTHLAGAAGEESRAQELMAEARLAARIQHPNVVTVFDVGEHEGVVFMILRYIEGDTLSGLRRSARERQTPLPDAVGLRILSDAFEGLHAAHELRDESGRLLGLVHRDFSPQNILVGKDGIARLTDFGIAKLTTETTLTQTGLVKGKVGYMSPEQARGKPLDRRSDVWAAGVVAWETLARARLYPPGDDVATLFRIVSERAPAIRSVRPDIPLAVDACIARALSAERDDRFATVEELRLAMIEAWSDPIATAEEVAAVVEDLAGEQLANRRKAIAEASAKPIVDRGVVEASSPVVPPSAADRKVDRKSRAFVNAAIFVATRFVIARHVLIAVAVLVYLVFFWLSRMAEQPAPTLPTPAADASDAGAAPEGAVRPTRAQGEPR